MSKLKTMHVSNDRDRLQYERPELVLHGLHTPLSLLTTMSESILHLEGDVENYQEGDEFY
ncbi:MAG: hypothetical protein Q4A64_06525 [Porphyromonadaceae bacterium]|nr:hypothetical protein [Porphyromonadaceae bacterium]